MDALRLTTLVLHVTFAAIWFGPKLVVPADARATAHAPDGADGGLSVRLKRGARLEALGALGTFGTGVLLLRGRDLGDVTFTVYLGTGAAVLLALSTVIVTRRARLALTAAIAARSRPAATAAARRLARAVDVESVLWIAALALMLA